MTTTIHTLNRQNPHNLFIDALAETRIRERYLSDSSLLPVVTKTIFHEGILYALHAAGLLDQLTFHGGTALQRFYNNPRLSEDLDFDCGTSQGRRLDSAEFYRTCDEFERIARDVLSRTYGIAGENIMIQPPRERIDPQSDDDSVQTWKIKININLHGKLQMIRVDVNNLPPHTSLIKTFKPDTVELSVPPFDMRVASREEILTNKILALVGRNRMQYRDIFDIYHLSEENVCLEEGLLRCKVKERFAQTIISERFNERMAVLREGQPALKDAFCSEIIRFVGMKRAEQFRKNDGATRMFAAVLPLLERCIAVLEFEQSSDAKSNDAERCAQMLIQSDLDPRESAGEIERLWGERAGEIRETLRRAASNPDAYGIPEEAFEAWGQAHGLGRTRTNPGPNCPVVSIVYDDF